MFTVATWLYKRLRDKFACALHYNERFVPFRDASTRVRPGRRVQDRSCIVRAIRRSQVTCQTTQQCKHRRVNVKFVLKCTCICFYSLYSAIRCGISLFLSWFSLNFLLHAQHVKNIATADHKEWTLVNVGAICTLCRKLRSHAVSSIACKMRGIHKRAM